MAYILKTVEEMFEDLTVTFDPAEPFHATPAERLWRAALNSLPLPAVACMCRVDRDYPAKRKSGWHLYRLCQFLQNEADEYIDELLEGGQFFYVATKLVKRQASTSEMSAFDILDEIGRAGDALRDAAQLLGVSFTPPKSRAAVRKVSWCERCWRTGHSNGRRRYFCHFHQPGAAAYHAARRAHRWRSAEQGSNGFRTYQREYFSQLNKVLPRAYLMWVNGDPELEPIWNGEPNWMNGVTHFSIDLAPLWGHFPNVGEFLKGNKRRSAVSFQNVPNMILALDPLGPRNQRIQRAAHEAMVRDHRILLRRLVMAECWLETEARRSANLGGDRRKRAIYPATMEKL